MKSSIFEQAHASTGLAARDLEKFLISYIVESAGRAFEANSEKSFYWELAKASRAERRLLLFCDKDRQEVTVSFETACELFEGEAHFVVSKVGTVHRSEITTDLPGVVSKALNQVNDWKPTYENLLG